MLRPLPEQKSLIYFASGLRLNGVDNQAQLRATINAAIRANVALCPIDARGLVARRRSATRRRPSPGGIGMFTGQLAQNAVTAFQRSQDTLYALAKDTGGKALFDYNDLSLGIVQAAESMTSYYILGYYSTHPANDGKFRRVKVSLRGGVAGELDYRQGYFADKEFAKFTAADKERQLEEALMLDDPVTDITIAMEVNYFQLNRAEYFVPVAVKIPGSELALARRRGAPRTRDRLHRRGQGRLRHHDPERARQAGHQAERRHRGAARDAADLSTRPASRCCPASTSSSSWRATTRPAASAPIRRRSRSRT